MGKLSFEDKINLYNDRKSGVSISSLCSKYKILHANVEYLTRLIDKHGYDILRKNRNRKFTSYEKKRIINLVLLNNESLLSVAIDEGLSSPGMLANWIKNYKEMGYNVNHKKVYKIMVKLGLKPLKRNKRKYSSYKRTIGKIADNLIERNFRADNPNEKWYTDVTKFNLRGEKCYLSPILDGYNGEVISYNTSKSPNLEQINDMLNKAFNKNNKLDGLIFHSDQGWQYQHASYQQRLKNKGIKQSMSRKGNSMDNGMMENFFGLLKTEMFYDQEDKYKTLDELIKAIDDYIYYYNYDRIKVK